MDMLLLVGVFVFVGVSVCLFACKKISKKNWGGGGGYNVQNRQILVLLSNRFWG